MEQRGTYHAQQCTANLNLRRSRHGAGKPADTCCPIILTMPKGTLVTSYLGVNDWTKVEHYKKPGSKRWTKVNDAWASDKYLKFYGYVDVKLQEIDTQEDI